jgi:hypothetical protein
VFANVGLAKKDLENIPKSSAKFLAFAHILARVLRPVARLRFVRRLLSRTTVAWGGAISHCTESAEHDRAADLAIEALREYRRQPAGTWGLSGRDYWWMFIHFAACSLEACSDQEKRGEVIDLARNDLEPFHRDDVALSYLAFSRWKYRESDYGKAVEFAAVAASADDTWAEPDFVLAANAWRWEAAPPWRTCPGCPQGPRDAIAHRTTPRVRAISAHHPEAEELLGR